MKKIVALIVTLCIALGLIALIVTNLPQKEKVVNVFSWTGYIDEVTLNKFEEDTGIKVNWSPMESMEDMLNKMHQGASGYDLIISSDYTLDILRQAGLIQKLDKSLLPNYENLDPTFLSQYYDPDNEYVIPHIAGCPLIIYDPSVVPFEITSYEDLWRPELADSVVTLDNDRVMIGIALKTLGYSMNETDPEILKLAQEKMMSLYGNIRAFGDNESYMAMDNREASVGFMFTPFVYMLKSSHPEFEVVYPSEGLGYGIDGYVIPANAENVENAHALLNYMMQPDVAANNAEYNYYMCVNAAAHDYLSAQFINDPVVNVPTELLTDAEFILNVGDAATLYTEIYTAFKLQ